MAENEFGTRVVSSPGNSRTTTRQAGATAARLTQPRSTASIVAGRSSRLGTESPLKGLRDSRTLRAQRDVASGKTGDVSKDTSPLARSGDFARDFAREAKEITSRRGLTRSQRKAQLGASKTAFALRKSGASGATADEALGLSRAATERGLTSSQRTQLTDSSNTLLKGALDEEDTDGSLFEQDLLKFFNIE